ncbi:MAG: hypothetical protein A2751_03525 [Candidatus Doudnabacteria bacterium RIFCSPHIGHO2_01_FULL_46_14]|uniref:Peptidase S8/S53 domain-containing protein n=1 Tax=Candidatus Doudnabacteria bacterium RIFCSPHIGHO2_01_FULL_46_14 TaxID=1817824 RepID=A0A1F5NLD3_9BACT|nr:MAG: hypothetical protein A2751_03525 [Candidatus Doudnabacteria bacterium RIFCSPHIGHO2_01_FULL_46_14]
MTLKKIYLNLLIVTLVLANFIFALPATADESSRKMVIYRGQDGASRIEVMELTAEDARALALDPHVLRVEDDATVFATAQTLPWGVDRIDADKAQDLSVGAGVRVAILDSGIDLEHPDLAGRIKGGYNALSPGASYDDDFGHGTHVAGIVAGLSNSIGIVGVAPAADLYAVKVLDSTGSGFVSDIIAGINWAAENGVQIINLSLATSSDVQSLHDAVSAAVSRGVLVVVAAGNDGGTVKYPAAYPEAIAVAALDQTDNLASWSSRGPEIDLLAPGASIYSTYAGGIYKLMRGTSMAAPHVSGAAALIMSKGSLSPDEVKTKLLNSAETLVSDYKLVDAENAVAQTANPPPVVPSNSTPVNQPVQTVPNPISAAPPQSSPTPVGHAPGTLINMNGTIWRITDDGQARQGFDSLEKFLSYRFKFTIVMRANTADMAKPDAGLMSWSDGVLFNDNGTVYQISGGQKHGFTSAGIFLALGFRFENVISGRPNAPTGAPIVDLDKHLPGTFVVGAGTVYLVTSSGLRGVPTPEVLFSWGGNWSEIVPVKSADRQVLTENLTLRMASW